MLCQEKSQTCGSLTNQQFRALAAKPLHVQSQSQSHNVDTQNVVALATIIHVACATVRNKSRTCGNAIVSVRNVATWDGQTSVCIASDRKSSYSDGGLGLALPSGQRA